MKNLLYIFLVVTLASCSKVKPKGEIATKDISIQDFNKLDLNGKFKVFYVQNPKNMVSVETYPNVFDNLKIEVKDKTLFISEKVKQKGWIFIISPYILQVTWKVLPWQIPRILQYLARFLFRYSVLKLKIMQSLWDRYWLIRPM